jgi:hypothetical protein
MNITPLCLPLLLAYVFRVESLVVFVQHLPEMPANRTVCVQYNPLANAEPLKMSRRIANQG